MNDSDDRLALLSETKQKLFAARRRAERVRRVSAAQRRLWFVQRMDPDSCVYNLAHVLRFRGPLDAALLTRCFAEVVRRHESLRTVFVAPDDAHDDVRALVSPTLQIDVPFLESDEATAPQRESQIIDELARPPFDLATGPLVRAAVVRFSASHHVFVLVVHHIVSDRWSLGILQTELARLYRADADPRALEPLRETYAQSLSDSEDDVAPADLAYWRAQLAGERQALHMPVDRLRPPQPTYRGAVYATTIERRLVEATTRVGGAERATPFVTFLAAFCVVLQRWTRQSDILIGTPVAGRTRSEQEPLLGLFVNTLPLRVHASPDDSFRALLAHVRGVALELLAHQAVPFDRLVRELLAERDSGRNPFFDVLFNFHNTPRGDAWPAGLEVETEDVDLGTSRLDLSLLLRPESDGSMTCRFEYRLDVFDPATIAAFASQYRTLLEGIVLDPDATIDRYRLSTARERETILNVWAVPDAARGSVSPSAYAETVHGLVEASASRTPDAVALVDENGALTYREFDERANRLAHALRTRGIRRDVPVGLFLERSIAAVVSMLAVLKAGGAYVPLDPAYPVQRVAHMLQSSGVRTILARRTSFAALERYDAELLDPDDEAAYERYPSSSPAAGVASNDLAYVMYTSGSTGMPKGAAIAHRGIVALLTATPSFACTPDHAFLLHAALTFDGSTCLWASLAFGGRLAVMPPGPFSLAEFGAQLAAFDITVLEASPALFHQLVEERCGDLRRLRRCLVGGDVLSPAVCAHFLRSVPSCSVHNGYGPTETTVIACSHEVRAASTERASIPVGRPIARARVYILDRHGEPVPACVPGEVWIGGDGLARGYVGDERLTARRFERDPFVTDSHARVYRAGDLARWLPSGEVEFLGRIDAQVKIRGFRIEPAEIEFALLAHPHVRNAAVVVRGDSPAGRHLIAYVDASGERPPEAQLRAFLQTKLPPHAIPSRLIALDALPKTPGGKLDRPALATLPLPETTHDEAETPQSELEQRIGTIVGQLLDVARVGKHDDFFSLGGHSLLATRVIARIADAFGVDVSLRAFFAAPTVAGLAELVAAAPRSPGAAQSNDAVDAHLATLSDAEIDTLLAQTLAQRAVRDAR